MLPLLKPYCKLPKAFFVAILAAYMFAPHNVWAFDSNSVLKMHVKIETMQKNVGQISTQDVQALNRIQQVELELNALRVRLQQYEDKLIQNLTQQQLANGQVLQRPLEDPYSDTAPLVDPQKLTQAVPLAAALPDGEQELNTVPEALRSQPTLKKPEPQAYAATALPEVASDGVNVGANVAGNLGNQAPDIMAFNEAKGYFDDAYYVLAERKFNQFIQYYRQSSLLSNAYFWLGESYYKRKNYNAAARVFYQGYRSNKKGAKAPDNLYKLAASLLLLGNKSDACAAYYEVDRRYSASHPQLSNMAQAKQKEHACL